jgi:hypothetical protein
VAWARVKESQQLKSAYLAERRRYARTVHYTMHARPVPPRTGGARWLALCSVPCVLCSVPCPPPARSAAAVGRSVMFGAGWGGAAWCRRQTEQELAECRQAPLAPKSRALASKTVRGAGRGGAGRGTGCRSAG